MSQKSITREINILKRTDGETMFLKSQLSELKIDLMS